VSIKNDGHYFCRAGGNRPDGLNEPVTGSLFACRESHFSAYLTLWFPLLIWWTPLCLIRQILTRRFRLYAYHYFIPVEFG
ncbi:hypothetical protein, partial [Escherichia coli]|uniref:hypothetical protein n=1 Tax=Escherichia coli TaxID=562 RepID=UPI001BC89DB6